MLRNTASALLKQTLANLELPKFVWVTEFSLADDVVSLDPCHRTVRAHVVTDATGSTDSIIITHLPGILIARWFDPSQPSATTDPDFFVMEEDNHLLPKVRGWNDYRSCVAGREPSSTISSANAEEGAIRTRLNSEVDRLAAIEHERWAQWQRHLHATAERLEDGRLVLPADQVASWERQVETAFADLDLAEQERDREQVRRYLPEIVQIISG